MGKKLSYRRPKSFEYDVCLSFAGENRDFVEDVAKALAARGVRVFYDEYEQVQLWGKDLFQHLSYVYEHAARFCVVFVSRQYAAKVWPTHELRSAQARAFTAHAEYILPARFDDTDLPGLHRTIGSVDLRHTNPGRLAQMIVAKVGAGPREPYFPPVPDLLYEALGAKAERRKDHVREAAYWFFNSLTRMTKQERRVLFLLFTVGCKAELPENVHVSVDLLRRLTGYPVTRLKAILGALSSLGYSCRVAQAEHEPDELGSSDYFYIEWAPLKVGLEGNHTKVADAVIKLATAGYCEEHAMESLERLDFSALSSVSITRLTSAAQCQHVAKTPAKRRLHPAHQRPRPADAPRHHGKGND